MPILYDNSCSPIDSNLKYEGYRLHGWFLKNHQTLGLKYWVICQGTSFWSLSSSDLRVVCHFILELLNNYCPLAVLSTNYTDKSCRLRTQLMTPGYTRTVPVYIGLADLALKGVLRGRADGFATKVTWLSIFARWPLSFYYSWASFLKDMFTK